MHASPFPPVLRWFLHELAPSGPTPTRRNTALAMCGLVKPVFRLPYVPLQREQREAGVKVLEGVREFIPGVKVCAGGVPRDVQWG